MARGRQVGPRPAPPGAHARHRNAMAAPERDRGVQGEQLACAGPPRGPTTLVGQGAARAGAMPAGVLEAARLAPGARAACISRATGARRRAHGHDASAGWEARPPARALGASTAEPPRQPHRPPPQATRRGAVTRVRGPGARRPGGRRPPGAVVAVSAQEPRPAGGEGPLAWR
jgi:hypothetical protein